MTRDLFGEDVPREPIPPQPTRVPPAAESFMIQACGNDLWTYRGVIVRCDMALKGLIGHWSTVEPLGRAIATSDRRMALCRMIDAHLGGRPACAT